MASGSIRTRMLLASALLGAVVAGGFVGLLRVVDDVATASQLGLRGEQVLVAAQRLERLVVDLETAERGYLLTGDAVFLEPATAARAGIPEQYAQLQQLLLDAGQRRAAAEIEGRVSDYLTEWHDPLLRTVQDDPEAARSLTAAGEGKRRMDHLRLLFERFERRQEQIDADRQERLGSLTAAARRTAMGGAAGSVALAVAFAAYLGRAVVRPVLLAAAAADRVARGDLAARVPETGTREFAGLGRAFNAMGRSLAEGREHMEGQRDELERQQAQLEEVVGALADEKGAVEELYRFGSRMAAETDVGSLVRTVLTGFCTIAGAEVGVLYGDGPGVAMPLLGARGLLADQLPPVVREGEGLPGLAVAERRVVSASHPGTGLHVPAFGTLLPVRHELHLPLLRGEAAHGLVTLARVGDEPFRPEQQAALVHLAEQAAVALANALAYRETQRQATLTQAVLDQAADAFVALDTDGLVITWNRQAEQTFGWSAREALGASFAERVLAPGDGRAFAQGLARFAATGTWSLLDARSECAGRHRDGHALPLELTVSAVRLGATTQLNVFARDLTERQRVDEAAGAQHAVVRALAESASFEEALPRVLAGLGERLGAARAAFWSCERDGEGLHRAAVWPDTGAGPDPGAAPAGAGAAPEDLPARVLASAEPTWVPDLAQEPELSRGTGVREAGLRSAFAFPVTSGGRVLGVVELLSSRPWAPDRHLGGAAVVMGGQLGDFLERNRAEQEAGRLQDEFFALVSHELRTPLTSILGYTELALDPRAEVGDEERDFLRVIDRSARRLLRLVGDLLLVARVQARQSFLLDIRPVDLAALARAAVAAAEPAARAKGVRLGLDVADPSPDVTLADPDRLGQALDNLVSNALKFTPPGGRIDVRLRAGDGAAVLEVADTGTGVPADELPRLFDRFFRARSATAGAVPGLGLGLAIVDAIVREHGGAVEVRSAVGEGTTFRVVLPLRAGERPPVSAATGRP